jgi:cytochrome c peroxidase
LKGFRKLEEISLSISFSTTSDPITKVKQMQKIGTAASIQHQGVLLAAAICLFLFSGLVQRHSETEPEPYTLQYPGNFGGRFNIPEGNPMTKEGVALGRMLFYEKSLSANGKISCESCHQQRLAFTDGMPFSKGVDGSFTARNSMSLANLLWVRNFFWDGRATSLEEQATFPLTDIHEMGQPLETSARKLRQMDVYKISFRNAFGSDSISPALIVKAISQFERTLISADSRYDRYLAGNYKPTREELEGMELFMGAPAPEKKLRGANCGHCHGGPKTFLELFHNNGLDSISKDSGREKFTGQASDHGRFRVPTLRNIALTAPYMHDGRFSTLEQVLDHYNEHVAPSPNLSSFLQNVSNEKNGKSLMLTKGEKNNIISFLHMLTDSTFINNPEFTNPHIKAQ